VLLIEGGGHAATDRIPLVDQMMAGLGLRIRHAAPISASFSTGEIALAVPDTAVRNEPAVRRKTF
jgi:hypothetical protein